MHGNSFYSLDVIISVGYRVESRRGTQFRIWATTALHDHLLRGYTPNERRVLIHHRPMTFSIGRPTSFRLAEL